jgi:hypothetical protein
MVFEVLALIFEKFVLFNEMIVLGVAWGLFLPAGNVELVLSVLVDSDLVILIQTAIITHLLIVAHFELVIVKYYISNIDKMKYISPIKH